MDQLFNAGPRFCDRHLLQQRAELHDEGDLSGRKDLSDADRGDQSQRYQHICFNIESGDQSDHCLQNNWQAAQNDGEPCHVKGERLELKQTANDCDAGNHKESDVLFDPAEFQQVL